MKQPPRVLVTRAAHQASALAEQLKSLGADPVVVPTIAIAEPESYAELDAALSRLDAFDWVVFTSANGVEAAQRRMKPGAAWPKIAVIGSATERAVRSALELRVSLVAETAVAESLAEALEKVAMRQDGSATRFLLVRAEKARDVIPERLRAAGAEVTIAAAYRTVMPDEAVRQVQTAFADDVDAVVFTSGSSVMHLASVLDAAHLKMPQGVRLASIGPVTSCAITERGWRVDVEASQARIETLATELMQYLLHAKSGAG